MEAQGNEFREQMAALRGTLAGLLDGADGIIHRLDNPSQLERFKESLLQKTVEYVVQVDMAMGEIHNRRQKILETQMSGIASSN